MSTTAEVVATGLPFGEGPVWCPDDNSLVCTSVSHGALYRVWPDAGAVERFAVTGGGANAAAPCVDGSFLVTQNGGIDLVALGHMAEAPPVRWETPGIQRVWPDGRVEAVTTEPMQAPNDLVVTSHGTAVFTDPGPYPPKDSIARIMALAPDGSATAVAGGYAYTNGIALDVDETLLVVVDDRRVLRFPDLGAGGADEAEPAIADVGETGGDGLCVDVDGRIYVALRRANGVGVYDADGAQLDFLPVDNSAGAVTNCCFGGTDGRTLFATEVRGNRVVAWEGLPSPGRSVHLWRGVG